VLVPAAIQLCAFPTQPSLGSRVTAACLELADAPKHLVDGRGLERASIYRAGGRALVNRERWIAGSGKASTDRLDEGTGPATRRYRKRTETARPGQSPRTPHGCGQRGGVQGLEPKAGRVGTPLSDDIEEHRNAGLKTAEHHDQRGETSPFTVSPLIRVVRDKERTVP
jgi:hypothetical protein